MYEPNTETSADAPQVPAGSEVAAPPTPLHLPAEPVRHDGTDEELDHRRRWPLVVLLSAVVLVGLLVAGWLFDTSSSRVARNVVLAGVDVGGLSESRLTGRVGEVAKSFSGTPVELRVGDDVYETTAGEIGLTVDVADTARKALDVGQDGPYPLRPLQWATSFVTERTAPLLFDVNAEQVASAVVELEGDDRTPPTEPTVQLVGGAFTVVPGLDGLGIDPGEVARRLPQAAEAIEGDAGVIRLEVERTAVPPLGSLQDARRAAAAGERLVGEPVEIATSAGARTIPPEQLRSWVRLSSVADGEVDVTFDRLAVAATLRDAFDDIEGRPVDATVTLDGGQPVIRADRRGLICCDDAAGPKILDALRAGERTVLLELVEGPARHTTEDAAAWQITQPVGGNHAWRDGAPTTAGPGFTTYHAASGARVANIHRIADLVRGVVVPPGGTFSINDHVGERTAAKGFVAAGAIRNGRHVDEIGGGISQFATTMFNAAYFAGLQIDESQAHSEYFNRYPRGREATMGFPAPDLVFTNDTPYGILIWTSYTDTSLTVTLYSSPHGIAEQTGITEGRSGNCAVVTTTRTVTYPDGSTKEDKFRAIYRPGEGIRC